MAVSLTGIKILEMLTILLFTVLLFVSQVNALSVVSQTVSIIKVENQSTSSLQISPPPAFGFEPTLFRLQITSVNVTDSPFSLVVYDIYDKIVFARGFSASGKRSVCENLNLNIAFVFLVTVGHILHCRCNGRCQLLHLRVPFLRLYC